MNLLKKKLKLWKVKQVTEEPEVVGEEKEEDSEEENKDEE